MKRTNIKHKIIICKICCPGNELLHQITTHQGEYELRIDMTNANGDTGHAHYSSFSVDNEASDYRLHVGKHSGTVGTYD